MAAKPKHTDAVRAMVRECAVRRLRLSAERPEDACDVTIYADRISPLRSGVRYGVHNWRYRATSWFATAELAAVAFVEAVGLTRARTAAIKLAKREGFDFPEVTETAIEKVA